MDACTGSDPVYGSCEDDFLAQVKMENEVGRISAMDSLLVMNAADSNS